MDINLNDIVGISIIGAVLLNLLWKLICYELRIHTANDYVVKIHYTITNGIDNVAKYAVKAYSENDAYIHAMKKYMRIREIGNVQRTEVIKIG